MLQRGWHAPPHVPRGFDFTGYMRSICADVVRRLDVFSHVDLDVVAIGFCQARNRTRFGMHASLTPLRFRGGAETMVRRGRPVRVQRLLSADGREMLYLLNFYLPRFFDEPFAEKVETVIHELWHISPAFDGDIRRHSGRCQAHGSSKRAYDSQMQSLARAYFAAAPPMELLDVFRHDFRGLQRAHGPIYGERYTRPRLVPVGG